MEREITNARRFRNSGLTNLFESIIEEEKYVEKKLTVEKEDNVIIRSRESMHYYEVFKIIRPPVDKEAKIMSIL